MNEITLQDNQAALILTANGEDIEVDISHEGHVSLAAGLCKVLALKLVDVNDSGRNCCSSYKKILKMGNRDPPVNVVVS